MLVVAVAHSLEVDGCCMEGTAGGASVGERLELLYQRVLLLLMFVVACCTYLQFSQWHTTLYIGSPVTLNCIAPQRHRPTASSAMARSSLLVWD